MSAFKEWRISLLVILALLSAALLIRPSIQYGVDIAGGSRIMLRLEASHVTIKVDNENVLDDLVVTLKDNLLLTVRAISYNEIAKEVTVEIGRAVTENLVATIIDNLGKVVDMQEKVSDATRNEVMHILQARVDPFGTIGTQFKPVGLNFILFEISGLEPERAKERLGRQGRLEAFIENTLVLRGGDIERVGLVRLESLPDGNYKYHVPFRISENGAQRFAEASTGKGGHRLVMYLDRPDDAILVFNKQLLVEQPTDMTYDENARMFYVTAGAYSFYLQVPAVGVLFDFIPPETFQFLQEQEGIKTRVVLLGDERDFAESVIDNVITLYPAIESIPKITGESIDEWIQRACGVKSAPEIAAEVAGTVAKDVEITGVRTSKRDAEADAKDLEILLSQRLPVRISFEGETEIEPRLGAEIKSEALRAGLGALIGIWALLYLRYRRLKIAGAIVGTMLCELIITLGLASAIRWTIGLPEIGGLLTVIGTGVDHQIIITDEVLRGGLPQARRVSLSGRIERAFSIIFAAAATTIAAMVSLASLGFGAMRGFALITIIGVLSAVIITRPAYARIISILLIKEQPEITAR